jgi:predicted GIY-YIG superfamily endonuclease
MKQIRKDTISKWESSGFLDGLSGHVKTNIAELYDCKASCLLNESKDEWSGTKFMYDINNEISNSFAESFESEASYLLNDDNYSVYMAECSDGSIYTGIAKDVSKRISVHNKGKGAKYTRSRLPVVLKWQKLCRDRSMASKYEYRIKKLTRKQKLKLIEYGK